MDGANEQCVAPIFPSQAFPTGEIALRRACNKTGYREGRATFWPIKSLYAPNSDACQPVKREIGAHAITAVRKTTRDVQRGENGRTASFTCGGCLRKTD